MKKVRSLIFIFYLILSFITYGENNEKRVLRQGKTLNEWLPTEETDKIYRYLNNAGIYLEGLGKNSYFYKGNMQEEFFLEIQGTFEDLNIYSRGFIEDKFEINGKEYGVRYRPNYNEIAIVYDDEKVYISNRLETVYLGIEEISKDKKELSNYFEENHSEITYRQITYEDKKTIYGIAFLESYEKKDDKEERKLYFGDFSIDEVTEIKRGLEDVNLVVDYHQMAELLMKSNPEMTLDSKRIESFLDEKIKGAFFTEDAMAIIGKAPLKTEDILELYNEGVFKRIGLQLNEVDGISFLEFPFFKNRKYILMEDNWTFISKNLDYIKEIKENTNKGKFLNELETLLEFKEEG